MLGFIVMRLDEPDLYVFLDQLEELYPRHAVKSDVDIV